MKESSGGTFSLKSMQDIMTCDETPSNCMHLYQVSTSNFGLKGDVKNKRINFIFAIKQRSDGKVNSHKWFY